MKRHMTDILPLEDCVKAFYKFERALSEAIDSMTRAYTKLYYMLCMEQVEGLYFEKSKRGHDFRHWSNRKRRRR